MKARQVESDPKTSKLLKCLKILTSCLYISAFTFGGGYTIVTLLRRKFVIELKWVSEKEMLDLTAIAQSSPGAIAVNAAVLVGYKVAGVLGAIFAMLGTVIPPIVIITIVSFIYKLVINNKIVEAVLKGMQAGVAALICDIVFTMATALFKGKKLTSAFNAVIMLTAFTLVFFVKISAIYIICGGIALGIIMFLAKFLFDKNKKSKTQMPPILDENTQAATTAATTETEVVESSENITNATPENTTSTNHTENTTDTTHAQNTDSENTPEKSDTQEVESV